MLNHVIIAALFLLGAVGAYADCPTQIECEHGNCVRVPIPSCRDASSVYINSPTTAQHATSKEAEPTSTAAIPNEQQDVNRVNKRKKTAGAQTKPAGTVTIKSYRNSNFEFGISYPSTWQLMQPKTGVTVFKAGDLNTGEVCTVAVHVSELLKNRDSSSVRNMTPNHVEEALRKSGFTNVGATESGITKLSNRDAFYAIVNSTLSSMGMEFPTRAIIVVTNKSGRVYTVGCSSSKDHFDRSRQLFISIIQTFIIDP